MTGRDIATCIPVGANGEVGGQARKPLALAGLNIDDLPAASVEPVEIDVIHPDIMLLDRLETPPGPMVRPTVFGT